MAAKSEPIVEKKAQRSSLYSAKTEYACLALLELARHHDDPNPLPLKSIAETHAISHRFLVQILLQLKAAGLVESTRGAAGGYHLGRAPDRITMADIVNVIDPPEVIHPEAAPTPLVRSIVGIWGQVLAAQKKILESATLADLLARAQDEGELSFQI